MERPTNLPRPKSTAALREFSTRAPKQPRTQISSSTSHPASSPALKKPLTQSLISKASSSLLRKPSTSIFQKSHLNLSVTTTIPSRLIQQASQPHPSPSLRRIPDRKPSSSHLKISPKLFKPPSQNFQKSATTYRSPPPPPRQSEKRESNNTPTPVNRPPQSNGRMTRDSGKGWASGTPLTNRRVVSAYTPGRAVSKTESTPKEETERRLQRSETARITSPSVSRLRSKPEPSLSSNRQPVQVNRHTRISPPTDENATPTPKWTSRLNPPSPSHSLASPTLSSTSFTVTPTQTPKPRRVPSISQTPLLPQFKGVMEEEMISNLEMEFDGSPDGFGSLRSLRGGVSRFSEVGGSGEGYMLGITEQGRKIPKGFLNPDNPLSLPAVAPQATASNVKRKDSVEVMTRAKEAEEALVRAEDRVRDVQVLLMRRRWEEIKRFAEREREDLVDYQAILRLLGEMEV